MKIYYTRISVITLLMLLPLFYSFSQGSVGIGTISPDSSSLLELQSTSKGLLIPRMDSTQRVGIVNPGLGLMVYETTTKAIWTWDGSNWKKEATETLDDLTDAKTGYANDNLFGGQGAGAQMQSGGDNNTAWGKDALSLATTGDDNTAIGQRALYLNQSGSWNTAIGSKSLFNNLGNYNTAVGRESMKDNTSGKDNTAVGSQSLWRNEEGDFNTAVGDQAMLINESGNNNVGVGNNALSNNVSGNSNTAIGGQALEDNTGNYNTAIGFKALPKNTIGDGNIAIGPFALNSNTINSGNIAIGDSSLFSNGTGLDLNDGFKNVAVGTSGLRHNIGSYNTGVGDEALYKNIEGSSNTAVGSGAMRNANGTSNSALGTDALQNTTGFHNAAFGVNALKNSKGYGNSTFGSGAAESLDLGVENTVAGAFAFLQSKFGSFNSVFGVGAMSTDTIGSSNTVIGYEALKNSSASSANSILGYQAGYLNDGMSNVFLGYQAGYSETGSNKLYVDNSSTSDPLIYGNFELDSLTINGYLTAEKNLKANSTMQVDGYANFFSNSYFRDLIFLTGETSISYLVMDSTTISTKPVESGDIPFDLWLQKSPYAGSATNYGNVRIPSHSRLGLGTVSTPSHGLTVASSDSKLFRLIGNGINGSQCRMNFGDENYVYIDEPIDDKMRIQADKIGMRREPMVNELEIEGGASKTTAGSWLANSDRRIKENIQEIENSFELIRNLRPVTFTYTKEWKDKHPTIENRPYYNFIAQEYGSIFPNALQGSGEYLEGDEDEILQIDTYDAQIVTIQAVKELIDENEKLKAVVNQLKTSLNNLSEKVTALISNSDLTNAND